MRLSFRPRIPGLAPSRAHWLQLAGLAVLAWAWWRATTAVYVPPDLLRAVPAPTAVAPGLAAPPPKSATVAATSVDVIVRANDTLDSIFRRLKLDLADLASLRALPGLR